MENDAKSCYDRMVPSLILLMSCSFGISKGACQAVGKTFQRMRDHLATRNGISEQSFGYTKEDPIFGSWQGATKSVINWVLTSSMIQKIHQDTVQGSSFKSTENQTEVNQTTIGFVDDNNHCVSQENSGPNNTKTPRKRPEVGKATALHRRNARAKQVFYLRDKLGTRR